MTALLASFVFALFPPRRERRSRRRAKSFPATYIPRDFPTAASRFTPAVPAKSVLAAQEPRVAPRNATVSMATADKAIVDNVTGLDPALLGPLYRSSVLIDGFKVPLPPGEWASLANSSITPTTAGGDAPFLGEIRQRRLIGAIRIFAMRSKDLPGEGFNEVKSCTEVNPGAHLCCDRR